MIYRIYPHIKCTLFEVHATQEYKILSTLLEFYSLNEVSVTQGYALYTGNTVICPIVSHN